MPPSLNSAASSCSPSIDLTGNRHSARILPTGSLEVIFAPPGLGLKLRAGGTAVNVARRAIVACEDPRAVGDEPTSAESGYPEPELAERHQRDLVLVQGEAVVESLEGIVVTVDLDVEAGEARMDLRSHVRGRRDHQRRGAPAVHRQWRAYDGEGARGEQRPSGGHRVCARPERACDDQPVAGEAHVELV